jgi:hypothetical protein
VEVVRSGTPTFQRAVEGVEDGRLARVVRTEDDRLLRIQVDHEVGQDAEVLDAESGDAKTAHARLTTFRQSGATERSALPFPCNRTRAMPLLLVLPGG